MMGRMQPPAHSPLNLQALGAGLSGALGHNTEPRLLARLRTVFGARDVFLTDSGTSALTLALLGSIRAHGPLVALPAYGCYDLATAAIGARARVLLYDLDTETLGPDFDSLRRALEAGASTIVVVHQYGLPVDMQAVSAMAAEYGALVIEDAAQALGTRLDVMPAGAVGHIAVLSFGRGKGLCGGGGGALLSNQAAGDGVLRYARQIVRGTRAGWRDLARATAQWLLARPALYRVPASLPFLALGQTVFHQPRWPQPLSRAAAELVVRGWNAAHAAAARRRSNAVRLLRAVQLSRTWRTFRVIADATPGYLRLPLLAPVDQRTTILDENTRALGIAGGYPQPLCRLDGFTEHIANIAEDFPGAVMLANGLFTLPTHTLLAPRDIERLENWLLRDLKSERAARNPHAQGTRAIA